MHQFITFSAQLIHRAQIYDTVSLTPLQIHQNDFIYIYADIEIELNKYFVGSNFMHILPLCI